MTAVELLREAKARARSKKDLVRDWGNTAENDAGRPVDPQSPTACRFCAVGFLTLAAGDELFDPCYDDAERILFKAAKQERFRVTKPHSLAKVRAVFNRAIALAAQRTKEQSK